MQRAAVNEDSFDRVRHTHSLDYSQVIIAAVTLIRAVVLKLVEGTEPRKFYASFHRTLRWKLKYSISFNELQPKAELPKVFERRAALRFSSFSGPHNSHKTFGWFLSRILLT